MKERLLNLSENCCPVDQLLKYVHAHKCLNCGKCTFGYEGAAQLEMMLTDITMKKSRSSDMEQMRKLCSIMKDQTLCEDGVELAATVLEVLARCEADFTAHIAKRGCRAAVCRRFITYHILADQCIGCGDCIEACEDDAIRGRKKFIHVIDQNECTQCGKCTAACHENAIVTAGTVKPRCPVKPIPCRR